MGKMTKATASPDSGGQIEIIEQSFCDQSAQANLAAKYLTFNVANETYGADIEFIKEIIEHGSFTRVPLSHSTIRGVINLRGHVVPVVDLAQRLGYESQAVNKRTCIIIIDMDDEGEKVDLGFVVDAVDEVVDLSNIDIEVAPSFGLDIRQDFIGGMGKLSSGDFIKLLDLKVVLSIAELSNIAAGK